MSNHPENKKPVILKLVKNKKKPKTGRYVSLAKDLAEAVKSHTIEAMAICYIDSAGFYHYCHTYEEGELGNLVTGIELMKAEMLKDYD